MKTHRVILASRNLYLRRKSPIKLFKGDRTNSIFITRSMTIAKYQWITIFIKDNQLFCISDSNTYKVVD